MSATTVDPGAVPTTIPLLVADRCDHGECNAQALVRYVVAFYVLDFCAHHAAKCEHRLKQQGFRIDQDIRKGNRRDHG